MAAITRITSVAYFEHAERIALRDDDAQRVRDEFEAIIAAEWPQPPRRLPRCAIGCPPSPRGHRAGHRSSVSAAAGICRGSQRWCRQRSPPAGRR